MNPEYDYLFKLLVRARDDAMRATARDACVRFRVGSFHAFIGHARVPLRSCTGNARARARACDADIDIDRERGRRWKNTRWIRSCEEGARVPSGGEREGLFSRVGLERGENGDARASDETTLVRSSDAREESD